MKATITDYVDKNRSNMFAESCEDVKDLLKVMCSSIRDTIALQIDRVFITMECDYTKVIIGNHKVNAQEMGRYERELRANIATLLKDCSRTALQDTEAGAKVTQD
jgi:hypothetical protein